MSSNKLVPLKDQKSTAIKQHILLQPTISTLLFSLPGMTSDLLCNSYKDEWKLCTLIKVRQCKPDEDSVILTKTLLQEFAKKPPFHLSYTTASSLSRHIIGNELADKLGLLSFNVPGQIVMILLYWFLRTVSFIQRGIPPLERRMYTFGSYCLNTLLEISLKGRKPSYIMKVYPWIWMSEDFLNSSSISDAP